MGIVDGWDVLLLVLFKESIDNLPLSPANIISLYLVKCTQCILLAPFNWYFTIISYNDNYLRFIINSFILFLNTIHKTIAFDIVNILVFVIVENYAISICYGNLCIFNNNGCGYVVCDGDVGDNDVLLNCLWLFMVLLRVHKNKHFSNITKFIYSHLPACAALGLWAINSLTARGYPTKSYVNGVNTLVSGLWSITIVVYDNKRCGVIIEGRLTRYWLYSGNNTLLYTGCYFVYDIDSKILCFCCDSRHKLSLRIDFRNDGLNIIYYLSILYISIN